MIDTIAPALLSLYHIFIILDDNDIIIIIKVIFVAGRRVPEL